MQAVKKHINEESNMWREIQNGDKEIFALFYDSHIHALHRYAQRITKDEVLIADAIQDVFYELWKNREKITLPKSFRYYLLAMLRNRIIFLSKDSKWVYIDIENEDASEIAASPESNYINLEFQATQKSLMQHYLKMLPDNQQQILVLRFFEELSYPQIADLLQIKEQSVRNLIQRAIQKLRELMTIQKT